MTIQPVTYRPIPAVAPVKRKSDEVGAQKADPRQRKKTARKPDPGTGEHLDLWV